MRQTNSKVGDWNYYQKSNLLTLWKCWIKRSFFGNVLYRVLPFGFIFILIIALIYDGVFVMEKDEFSFVKDSSNSICMMIIFILSYFLGATYPQWIETCINALRKYQIDKNTEDTLERTTICVQTLNLFAVIAAVAGSPFVLVAKAGGMDWMNGMSNITNVLYNLFLGITWYMSIELLIYVISGCILIYKVMETQTFCIWNENYERVYQDMRTVAWTLNITLSYSIFYVVGAFVIIINDNINANYGLELTFHKYPIVAAILVFAMVVGLLYVIVPIKTFRKVIEGQKNTKLIEIEDKNISIEEKELTKSRIHKINSSIFIGVGNKVLVTISAISPLITFIIPEMMKIAESLF